MRIAVIETMEDTQLGALGAALDEAGAAIETFRVWQGEALPGSDDHHALIVPGGWPGACDDAEFPYLPHIAALMRRFDEAGKPVVGICLGAQLLARAHGAQNILDATPEFGWTALEVTPEGRADTVFADLAAGFDSFQWHRDTFTLPEGGVCLVTNGTVANQCFRVGRASYGMQFHFEATGEVVDAWTRDNPRRVEAIAPGWFDRAGAEAARHAAAADAAGLTIARGLVRIIAEGAR